MNNFPDEDPKLLNFLQQNRAIVPPGSPELEDLLMSEIDFIPIEKHQHVRDWRRYLAVGIGMAATGILGIGMHQLMNPPEPSMAQLQQLNLFLEAHAQTSLAIDNSNESHDGLVDADPDLLLETDLDIDSVI